MFPATRGANKHLFPVYNLPLIFYPISTLQGLGVDQILLVTNPGDVPAFKRLLGDSVTYATQETPGGIAEGVMIGAEWLEGEPFYLALGDNVFFGQPEPSEGATAYVMPYTGSDIRRFGVYNASTGKIEEKPHEPGSDLVAVGLYHLPACAVDRVRDQKPSKRGELEITDLLNSYGDSLRIQRISGEWFDCGTFDSLLFASLHKALRTND